MKRIKNAGEAEFVDEKSKSFFEEQFFELPAICQTPKLAIYRQRAGLTQKQLADMAGMNVMQISKIERGLIVSRNICLANAVKLAKALNINPEDLL